ncbi:hypothetical protein E2562_011906 [Oryza meyeriana var. granulata]|uniref:Uncharacterized protein n=1 Tax=Oryza meyeriana var. granulata TaxID=110450 RepID=A0A6G1CFK7_9ORYZ|nr:hypothetical protein E2562_011906 [Oryza meyeriana var. granulata]
MAHANVRRSGRAGAIAATLFQRLVSATSSAACLHWFAPGLPFQFVVLQNNLRSATTASCVDYQRHRIMETVEAEGQHDSVFRINREAVPSSSSPCQTPSTGHQTQDAHRWKTSRWEWLWNAGDEEKKICVLMF